MITHPRTEELAESVRLWIDEIRPTLDPRNAFLARVAANAMATIAREITQGPAAEAAAIAGMAGVLGQEGTYAELNSALCARIRSGELTVETPGLLAALTTMARDQIAIDQPSYKPEGTVRSE
ncbi:MAG: protein kinase [Alphaproteobacteria bacterium]|nr:protein kinase [Alphaproteobacteria bacterium]MBU1514022.1 protein kinase [Alphaproteobacteria bacterium]MBU2093038.1 protein kinase [Alphaproteobacteria bacterium]MBU2151759.1 protein kinase [Alphaproteobacteria bacterium]MBU2309421.1 protein kinase [Alphaproteobacteria bacterium]